MAHYWRASMRTPLDEKAMMKRLSEELAELTWKMGDSEVEGLHISGRSRAGETIRVSFEDDVVDVDIDTRFATYDAADAGKAEAELVRRVVEEVLPGIGHVTKVTEC